MHVLDIMLHTCNVLYKVAKHSKTAVSLKQLPTVSLLLAARPVHEDSNFVAHKITRQ